MVGIGLDGNESVGPPALYAEAYALAKKGGLKCTAHCCEDYLTPLQAPPTNYLICRDVLKCDRIDHGYTVVDEPEFARQCAERGVLFTVVPTNSHYLRTLPPQRWAQDHPIRRMPALGLHIHPNTDDPTLHHVTPSRAWSMMVRDFGYSIADLRQCLHNGLDSAWIDAATRAAWRADWSARFDALRAELPDL